jgi:hypothetical protein
MNKKEKLQWKIIEKAKDSLLKYPKKNNINISAIHFIPMLDSSIEVYVFYEKDDDIVQNQINGTTERIKEDFLEIVSDLGYFNNFKDNISFIFDSHEKVVNNFEDSYFLRLR